MKAQLVMLALMIGSVFATGFVLADGYSNEEDADILVAGASNTGSTTVSVETEEETETEVESSNSELEVSSESEANLALSEEDIGRDLPAKWRSYPATAFYGQGYATSGDEGAFVTFAGVQKAFVRPDSETSGKIYTYMRMKIGGENYRLERSLDSLEDNLDKTLEFNVYHKDELVGKATLSVKDELKGNFKIRTGEVTVDGKTWELDVATDTRVVSQDKTGKISTSKDARKNIEGDSNSLKTETEVSGSVKESFLRKFFNSFRRDRGATISETS